jgi:hypothetical protein
MSPSVAAFQYFHPQREQPAAVRARLQLGHRHAVAHEEEVVERQRLVVRVDGLLEHLLVDRPLELQRGVHVGGGEREPLGLEDEGDAVLLQVAADLALAEAEVELLAEALLADVGAVDARDDAGRQPLALDLRALHQLARDHVHLGEPRILVLRQRVAEVRLVGRDAVLADHRLDARAEDLGGHPHGLDDVGEALLAAALLARLLVELAVPLGVVVARHRDAEAVGLLADHGLLDHDLQHRGRAAARVREVLAHPLDEHAAEVAEVDVLPAHARDDAGRQRLARGRRLRRGGGRARARDRRVRAVRRRRRPDARPRPAGRARTARESTGGWGSRRSTSTRGEDRPKVGAPGRGQGGSL